jgi:hypothetical protein
MNLRKTSVKNCHSLCRRWRRPPARRANVKLECALERGLCTKVDVIYRSFYRTGIILQI